MSRPIALVVDDDASIRTMLARVLGVFGFSVLAAANGQEALALIDAHIGPIRLLVTDVDMPGLTGGELAQALGATRPDLAVLFVSGRSAPRGLSDTVRGQAAAFLAKPFTLDGLRTTVVDLVGPLPAADRGR
jgi:two-component system cell cycle sensor histidine kinase/response regulator CckA